MSCGLALLVLSAAGGASRSYAGSAGELDAAFAVGLTFDGAVYALAAQPDGRNLVGGTFTAFDGVPRNRLARLNQDGTLDDTFDPGGGFTGGEVRGSDRTRVENLALADPSCVLVLGSFTQCDGLPRAGLARVLAGSAAVPRSLRLADPRLTQDAFAVSVQTEVLKIYALQRTDQLPVISWTTVVTGPGTGGPITLTDPQPAAARSFYRVSTD